MLLALKYNNHYLFKKSTFIFKYLIFCTISVINESKENYQKYNSERIHKNISILIKDNNVLNKF
jgi:poly(A) polymerase Pap1